MDPDVVRRVRWPGVALALFGVTVMLANAVGLGWLLYRVVLPVVTSVMDGADLGLILPGMWSQAPVLLSSVFALVGGLLTTIGGARLASGRSPALVYVGAIVAMLPCTAGFAPLIPVPCCCVGFPLGAWAIMVLQDAGVRRAMGRV